MTTSATLSNGDLTLFVYLICLLQGSYVWYKCKIGLKQLIKWNYNYNRNISSHIKEYYKLKGHQEKHNNIYHFVAYISYQLDKILGFLIFIYYVVNKINHSIIQSINQSHHHKQHQMQSKLIVAFKLYGNWHKLIICLNDLAHQLCIASILIINMLIKRRKMKLVPTIAKLSEQYKRCTLTFPLTFFNSDGTLL